MSHPASVRESGCGGVAFHRAVVIGPTVEDESSARGWLAGAPPREGGMCGLGRGESHIASALEQGEVHREGRAGVRPPTSTLHL